MLPEPQNTALSAAPQVEMLRSGERIKTLLSAHPSARSWKAFVDRQMRRCAWMCKTCVVVVITFWTFISGLAVAQTPEISYAKLVDRIGGARLHLDLGESAGLIDRKAGSYAIVQGASSGRAPRLAHLNNLGSLKLDGGRVHVLDAEWMRNQSGTITLFVRGDKDVRKKTLLERGDLRLSVGRNNEIVFALGNQTVKGGHIMARQRAHVAISWGAKGLRLYQDGMVIGAVPVQTSPSSAADLTIGARGDFSDAFVGYLDEAVWFESQIRDTDVRDLSQSNLFVIGSSIRYVSPSGSDNRNGISRDSAWKSMRHAFKRASEWDTLVVGGGSYDETNVTFSAAGSFDQPKLVMRDPSSSSKPIIDGSVRNYRGPVAGWQLVNGNLKLWRTTGTIPPGWRLVGYHGTDQAGGMRWYNLVPARDVMKNAAITETNTYPGPMAWYEGGKVYVRLELVARDHGAVRPPLSAASRPRSQQSGSSNLFR